MWLMRHMNPSHKEKHLYPLQTLLYHPARSQVPQPPSAQVLYHSLFPCLPRLSSYCRCHSLKALRYTSQHPHWICRSPALQVPCLPHEPCHFPCRGQDTFLPSGNCPRSALCICRVHMHLLSRQNMPA